MKIELWEGGGRELQFRNERVVSIANSSTIQRSKGLLDPWIKGTMPSDSTSIWSSCQG